LRFGECDGKGHIARLAKTGGAPEMLADIGSLPSTAVDAPITLAVDDASIYWTADDGNVNKVSKQGGAVVPLVTGGQALGGLRLQGNDVYFVDAGHVETVSPYLPIDGAIEKVSKQGGPVTTLASGITQAAWLAVDANHVYFSAAPNPNQELYAGVYRTGLGGGASELIAMGPYIGETVYQLEVDGPNLLYTTPDVPFVWTSPTSLLQPPVPNDPTQAASNVPNVQNFTFDADYIYASVYQDWDTNRRILRVPRAGGPATEIVHEMGGNIIWFVVDAQYLYWVVREEAMSPSLATLYRMAK
jgi:hypothetical protein